MSDVPHSHRQFLDVVNGIVIGRTRPEELTRKLRQALLDFGSETPDNLNCANRVEVDRVGSKIGPKICGQDALFRDIAHALEDEPLPEALKSHFPDTSEQDWDAFTRMTTLIYILMTPDR